MNTRFIASIIAGVLVSSAAQAGSTLSIEETYSPSAKSQISSASEYNVSNYYKMPFHLQQAAHKTSCTWQVAQYNLNPLRVVYTQEASIDSNYLASPNLHLVC